MHLDESARRERCPKAVWCVRRELTCQEPVMDEAPHQLVIVIG